MANSHNIFPWRAQQIHEKNIYNKTYFLFLSVSSLFLIIAKELNQIINKTVCGSPQSISKFCNIFLKNKRNRSFTAQNSRLNTSSLRLLCLVSNVSRPSQKYSDQKNLSLELVRFVFHCTRCSEIQTWQAPGKRWIWSTEKQTYLSY